MKKLFCKVLAFVMIISACVINRAASTDVYASDFVDLAGGAFRYNYTDYLSLSPFARRETRANDNRMNEVLFSFPAVTNASPDMNGGTYTLSYMYEDSYQAQVKFWMSNNDMRITYSYVDIRDDLNPIKQSLFEINSAGVAEKIRAYNGNDTVTLDSVNNYRSFDLSSPNGEDVVYTLQRGSNIAFTLYNSENPLAEKETIKILWSTADNGRIYFSTNQAYPSPKIYEFNLKGERIGGAVYGPLGAEGKTFRVSTGYNTGSTEQVRVSSFANSTDKQSGKNLIDKTGSNPDTLWPGDNERVIRFEIALPRVWDNSVKRFVPVEMVDDGTGNLTHKYDMVGAEFTLGESTVSFLIKDFLKDDSSNENYKYTVGTETGTLDIYNRDAATVYNGSNFKLETPAGISPPADKSSVVGDATSFGTYDVHTRVPFVIEQPDVDSYALTITKPFRLFTRSGAINNIYGVYTVYRRMSDEPPADPGEDWTGERVASINVQLGTNDREETLSMPIPLTIHDAVNMPYYYRVDFTPAGTSADNRMKSQTVAYKQSSDMDMMQIPTELTIISSDTVSVKDGSFEQDYVKVKFSYAIGFDQVLKNLYNNGIATSVDYLFSANPEPRQTGMRHLMTLRMSLDDYSISLAPRDPNIESPYPADGIKFIDGSYSTYIRANMEHGVVTAEVLIPAAPFTDPSKTTVPSFFYYPNIIYAKVRGSHDTVGEKYETGFSNEVSLSISSPAIYEVPSPLGFAADNTTEHSFELSWRLSVSEIFDYMEYMLNPKKHTLSDDSVLYDIYVGQYFSSMEKLTKGETAELTIYELSVSSNTVDFSSLSAPNGETALQFLRDGGIFCLKGFTQSGFKPQTGIRKTRDFFDHKVFLEGLDDNTVYFAAANTSFDKYDTIWQDSDSLIGVPELNDKGTDQEQPVVISPSAEDNDLSRITQLVTVTTSVAVDEPSPNDYEPLTPTELSQTANEDGVDISWNSLEQTLPPGGITADMFEYEIIRVKSNVLPDVFLSNKSVLSDALNEIRSEYPQMELAAWRTDMTESPSSNALQELTGNSRVPSGSVTYSATNTRNTMTDRSVEPGTMYAYYVRTIQKNVNNANALKCSTWARVSVTTAALKGPVNLRSLNTGAYDPMREAFLGFDVPVMIDDIENGRYSLSYSIKRDTGAWEETIIPDGSLMGGEKEVDDPAGYYGYNYILTGLDPGSSYLIRVRLTKNDSGDKSVWSNVITYRTDVDPDEPEDENKKWEDYFKKKLEELLKKPYWTTRSVGESSYEAVYRGAMIDGEIGAAADGVIPLGKEGVREQVYFIPAEAMSKTVAAGKNLKIVSENVTEIIPAGVVDSNSTQAVKDIIGQLKDNKIKDYYVMFSLKLTLPNEKINGNDPLTDRIEITIKTVGFKELEPLWDANTASDLKIKIEDRTYLSNYYRRISSAIKSGYSDEEMVRLIDTLAAEFEKDYADTVRRSFNDTRQYEYEASSFVSPVRIVAFPAQQAGQTSIAGYQLVQGQWQSMPAMPYQTGRSILPLTPGTFIFSGATVYIPGINEMTDGDAITAFVIKYGLDDFFGKGESFSTVIPVTNDALTGTIARMAGASNTQDAAAFLRSKGVSVSTRNAYSPSTNENTVYLLMSLYEIKTNTKVSAIRITNHNITKDITGIGANYVPYYKAAYNIGIMDKNYMPKQQMSVKEFLQILGKLAGKLNL